MKKKPGISYRAAANGYFFLAAVMTTFLIFIPIPLAIQMIPPTVVCLVLVGITHWQCRDED